MVRAPSVRKSRIGTGEGDRGVAHVLGMIGSVLMTVRQRMRVLAVAGLLSIVGTSAFAQNAVNTANVSAPAGVSDPTPGNNSATDSDTIVAPQLTLIKTASPSPFTVGVTANYTLTLTNTGTTATTAVTTITDTIPTGLTIGTLPAGCVLNPPASQTVVCTVAAGLAVSATASFVIPVTPQASLGTTTVTNSARASGGGDATCPAAGATQPRCNPTIDTPVNTPANLSVVKTGPATVLAGASYSYTLTLTNSGQTATGAIVVVQDQLPAGVVATAVTGATCGALPSPAGALLTCTVPGPIAAGGNAVVMLTVTAPATGGSIVNYAATATNGSGNPATPPGPGCTSDVVTSCASAPTTVTPAVPVVNFCAVNSMFNITQSANAGAFYRYTIGAGTDVLVPELNLAVPNNLNALMVDPVRNRLLFVSHVGGQSTLYAYDAGNGGWYVAAGPTTTPDFPRAAMSPAGIGYLIAGTASPAVWRVQSTGTYSYSMAPFGTLTYDFAPTSASSGDLAFDAAGQGWLAAGVDLYTIDVSVASPVAVRQQRPLLNGSPSTIQWAGLAFGSDARLYFANNSSPSRYYALDLSTGNLANVASTAANQSRDLASCAFPATGQPAQLQVQKTLASVNGAPYTAGAPVRPGDVLGYAIRIEHVGGTLAATLFPGDIVETLPANTTVVVAGNDFTCAGSNCPNTAAVNIPVGGNATLDFFVQVDQPLPAGVLQIANAVAVDGVDCAVAGNDCSETTPIGPLVSVVKTGPATVVVGASYAYTLTLTNTGGTATGTPVIVQDQLPAGVIATAATGATCSNLNVAGALLTCSIGTAIPANGGTAIVTLTATAPSTPGSITNYAATSTSGSGNPSTPPGPACTSNATVSCSSTTTTVDAPQLTLTKTASAPVFTVGVPASYTLSVQNTGTTATTAPATITDVIPTGLTIGTLPAGCVLNPAGSQTVVCTIPAGLAVNATASFVIPVTPQASTAGTTLTNSATVSGGGDATCPAAGRCSSTTDTPVTGTASLTLDKIASVADTNGNTVIGDAGDTITYAFSATNTGTVTLAPVTVTDPLLPGLVCSIPTLAPGETASCAPTGNTYVITAADVAAGSRANTATATGDAPGTIPDPTASDTATAPTAATPVASLTLNKTAVVADTNGNTIIGDAGDTITYAFSATNIGTVTLAPVTVTDPLLPGLVCSIPTLAPGATASCAATGNTYVITAADVAAGSRANTATATGDAPGTIPDPTASDTETTPTAGTPVASLTLNKTATVADTNGNTVLGDAGDTITYAFSATNTGTVTLAPVTITDPLLPGLVCSIPTLAPGATASCAATGNTYVITAADVAAGSRANTATATGDAPGTIPDPTASDTETTPTAVTPVASLTLNKTATVADTNGNTVLGDAGDTITYAFSATNTGTVTLAPVTITDPLLPGLVCSIPTLAPGATASCNATGNTYVITAADAAAGNVINTATASGDAPGTIPDPTGSDTETTPTAATPAPAITLLKTAVSGNPYDSVGDVIDYTYVVTNIGNVSINGLVVTDDRIATVTCPVTTLAPGESTTCTASYVVTQADLDSGTVVNIATATATPTAGTLPPATDTEIASAIAAPAIAVTKTATLTTDNGTPGFGDAGDVITYAVVVRNTGNVTLTGLTVVDRFEGGAPVSLNCTPTTLPPGATATCASYTHTITVAEANAGGTLDNAVTASAQASSGGGPVTVSATSVATVAVQGDPATLRVVKTAAPRDVSIGDLVRYTLQIENTGTVDVVDATVIDTPPAGFTYVDNSLTVADADNAGRLVGTYPIRVDQIDVDAGERATVTYLLRVGAGVRPGTHTNSAYVQDGGATVSNIATADVQLVGDPMLDESLLVGTVFDDGDGDGKQDVGEPGIPGVRIASVEGLLIETDQYGRYHLAGVAGGPWERGRNFILKVDPSTLPPGSTLTTDNPLVRRITPGIPVRFDFGVKLPPGDIQGGRQDVELELGAVLFNTESAEIRSEYLPVIDKMAEQVRSHESGDVVIAANGETQALAYDRAKAVQAVLLKRLTPAQAAGLTISLRTDLANPASTLVSIGSLPVLGTVLFDTDTSDIKPQYGPVIDKVAADIETLDGGVIGVVGHADKRGSDAYNVALGLRRAQAVYDAIAARLSPSARSKLQVEVSDNPTAPVGSNESGEPR